MDWESVFTRRQIGGLIQETEEALREFAIWLDQQKYDGEIEIIGFFGIADKLVWKKGQFFIKWWSYETSSERYTPTNLDTALISRFRLAPSHLEKAKKTITDRLSEKMGGEESEHALTELRKLLDSPTIPELVFPLWLVPRRLLIKRYGIVKVGIMGEEVAEESEWPDLIKRYSLKAEFLAQLRRQIEA